MRRDLRVFMTWGVGLMAVGGEGRVWYVLLSSCIMCGTDVSSSTVRVYRRWICDRWWRGLVCV